MSERGLEYVVRLQGRHRHIAVVEDATVRNTETIIEGDLSFDLSLF